MVLIACFKKSKLCCYCPGKEAAMSIIVVSLPCTAYLCGALIALYFQQVSNFVFIKSKLSTLQYFFKLALFPFLRFIAFIYQRQYFIPAKFFGGTAYKMLG